MNAFCALKWAGRLGIAIFLCGASPVLAQTFSSGSTGADGAFNPTCAPTPCTVTPPVTLPPSGVFNYTTVNVPAGVTVTYTRNAANTPVTILATGNVTVAGTISVNGTKGTDGAATGPLFNAGALGGPGGFTGGQGGSRDGVFLPSTGQGPGGGAPGLTGVGTYGASASFVSLLPLFGGSGGGGGNRAGSFSGASGAGGGGAVVIASSTQITVTGTVRANGGDAGLLSGSFNSGAGSGGAIRLVAPQINGAGILQATGGSGAVVGGAGRIRLEAFTLGFTGTSSPAASPSTAPGPVTAASTPALVNLPTLTISSVGSTGAPAVPGGSYTTADVSLPAGTTNPVSVTLTATNIPVGTVFSVVLLPQFGAATTVNSSGSAGTFATSTATANVSFPLGQVSVLNAFGSFTLPQLASLFPLLDGEPVEHILVAANYGEPSTLSLVTKSGKTVTVDKLPPDEQRRVALAWNVLHASR
jgi:hypothetical protein